MRYSDASSLLSEGLTPDLLLLESHSARSSGSGSAAQISLSSATQQVLNSALNQPQGLTFNPSDLTNSTLYVANSSMATKSAAVAGSILQSVTATPRTSSGVCRREVLTIGLKSREEGYKDCGSALITLEPQPGVLSCHSETEKRQQACRGRTCCRCTCAHEGWCREELPGAGIAGCSPLRQVQPFCDAVCRNSILLNLKTFRPCAPLK